MNRTAEDAVFDRLDVYATTAPNPNDVKLSRVGTEKYLTRFLDSYQLKAVTADALRSYRLWLEKKPISSQTVADLFSDVRCCMLWCKDAGLLHARGREAIERIEVSSAPADAHLCLSVQGSP
jgi:hypothetical protein